ncbi:hypothetical protein GCM10029964_043900 [Kibdelosporangium lantanae]
MVRDGRHHRPDRHAEADLLRRRQEGPDCYTRPVRLHDELTEALGTFPLFQYWGPTASIASSRWIVGAARKILAEHQPDLLTVYIPHLDYDLQRFGPNAPEARAAARAVDAEIAPLLRDAEAAGATVVALSEYGITDASRAIDINRALRADGLLEVYTQDGMEYLDPWVSRAFAVADHQVAHVYVNDNADIPRVRDIVAGLSGVDMVLDRVEQARYQLDHPRAGSWWRSPSRTRGSRTTTGSTTTGPRTSPVVWRSTASPATTPPSCSSTPRTRSSRRRPD